MPVFTSSIEVTADYPTIKPSLNLNFLKARALDSRVTLERASAATYIGRDGLVKYAGEDEPRFDHDPDTLESLGLLLEESRTNIAIYGDDMSQYTSVNMTKTANDAVAPDGTTTATKLEHGGGGNTWYLDFTSPTSTPASGAGTYTYSVWVKAPDDQPDDYYGCKIAILTTTGNNTEVAFPLKKTWSRISVTKTYASETGNIRIHPIIFRNSPGNSDAGYVMPTHVWVWGSHWETGSFPTSYIPTNGAAVTRAADFGYITGDNFSSWFNQSEGSLDVGYRLGYNNALGYDNVYDNFSMRVCQISNQSANNVIDLVVGSGGGNGGYWFINTGGTQQFSSSSVVNSAQVGADRNFRSVLAYKENDCAAQQDKISTITTDTNVTLVTDYDRLLFYQIGNGGDQIQGHLKYIRYYPKRITNDQVTQLSQDGNV